MQDAFQQREDRNPEAGREQNVDPTHVPPDPVPDLDPIRFARPDALDIGEVDLSGSNVQETELAKFGWSADRDGCDRLIFGKYMERDDKS